VASAAGAAAGAAGAAQPASIAAITSTPSSMVNHFWVFIHILLLNCNYLKQPEVGCNTTEEALANLQAL
jgi:hypothetical protein